MAGGRKPDYRVTYKAKDGSRFDCGVAWASEKFPGIYDLKPQKANEDGQYPKMRLSEAARRCEDGDGFLSIMAPKPTAEARSGGTYDRPPRTNRDDDDLPF